MKKLLSLLLALAMLFMLAACDDKKTEDGDDGDDRSSTAPVADTSKDDDGNKTDTSKSDGTGSTLTKCDYCYDIEGNDRKCDVCGYWMYEKGEAWTAEVPENLKVTLFNYRYNYQVIEKIGDEIFVKEYYDKDAYESDGDRVEDFKTMTDNYARDYYNGEYSEWRENNFAVNYGDKYELFARYVLQNLTGSSLSSTVEKCLEAQTLGTETIAGKECVIKEYEGYFGIKYKLWMWNSIPLKSAQIDTNTATEYTVMYEILEWDTDITEFSSNMPE